jgi:hypothetical protein
VPFCGGVDLHIGHGDPVNPTTSLEKGQIAEQLGVGQNTVNGYTSQCSSFGYPLGDWVTFEEKSVGLSSQV